MLKPVENLYSNKIFAASMTVFTMYSANKNTLLMSAERSSPKSKPVEAPKSPMVKPLAIKSAWICSFLAPNEASTEISSRRS